jgi:hypothetical protein
MTGTGTGTNASYRKTKSGQWVVYGPASVIVPGATVTVTTRGGQSKVEYITTIGRAFSVSGVPMVYGYPGTAPLETASGTPCVMNPQYCPAGCATPDEHNARGEALAAELNSRPRTTTHARSPRGMCQACGERRAVTTARDLSGSVGDVCGVCERSGAVSFA